MINVQVGGVGLNPLSVQKGNEVYHNIRDSDLFGTSRHAHQISPTKKSLLGLHLLNCTDWREPCKYEAFLASLLSKLGQY